MSTKLKVEMGIVKQASRPVRLHPFILEFPIIAVFIRVNRYPINYFAAILLSHFIYGKHCPVFYRPKSLCELTIAENLHSTNLYSMLLNMYKYTPFQN